MLASRYVAVPFEPFSLVFFQERGILPGEIKQSVNWVKDVRMLTPRILNRQLNEKNRKIRQMLDSEIEGKILSLVKDDFLIFEELSD